MDIRTGVIGYPVKHSLSPIMHNSAYKYCNIDAQYDAIEILPEHSRSEILSLFDHGYTGLNVTMPYKEVACEIALTHGSASRLHSVNTLIADESGQLHGYSTDGDGFINAIIEEGLDPGALQVMVIGAGAAARAISDALVSSQANVLLTARSLEKSLEAVQKIVIPLSERQSAIGTIDVVEFSQRHERVKECQLVVNATPVGMTQDSKTDSSLPIDVTYIDPESFVFDTIYFPQKTELIRQASERGCPTSNGLPMLLHQGALAFTLMVHEEAPIEVMRQALLDYLESES